MDTINNQNVWTALVSVGVGSLGTRLVELWFKRDSARHADEHDAQTELRRALQEQIDSLRNDVRRLGEDVDYWRRRAYDLERQHAVLIHEHEDLQEELARLRSHVVASTEGTAA